MSLNSVNFRIVVSICAVIKFGNNLSKLVLNQRATATVFLVFNVTIQNIRIEARGWRCF